MTDVTAVRDRLQTRARSRLARPLAPVSLRAQAALLLSAFLLGGVISALLFVGVWRHTAAEGDRARTAQLASRHALAASKAELARAEQALTASQAALAAIRRDRRRLAGELLALRTTTHRAATSLTPRLQAIADDAGSLTRRSEKLGTALTSLRDYLGNASATGVDPAFLEAQVSYLIGSAAATGSTAADLARRAEQAQAAAAPLQHHG